MDKMFEGHEFIKLDAAGKYVVDLTEYKIYEVVHNYKGEAVSNKHAADITPDLRFERFRDIPVRIIRKAKAVVRAKMDRVNELERLPVDG